MFFFDKYLFALYVALPKFDIIVDGPDYISSQDSSIKVAVIGK